MNRSELHQEIERLHRASFSWALACCSRDRAEAEDVLQNVYLKVLDGRARFSGKATFKTWLFSVIRKTAADSWRRQLFHRAKLADYSATVHADGRGESAERTHHRSQTAVVLRELLSELPRRQREVVLLVFQHDLTVSAAAQVMGVSINAARTHYHRGKARMRHMLADRGEGDG
ncbi:MAG: RNA polymerase sigma factor [Candidatus Binatia bacterium]